jgi:hypothetical protein
MVKSILSLILMFVVAGCGADKKQSEPQQPNTVSTQQEVMAEWEPNNLSKAVLSRSQRFGSVYPAVLAAFEGDEELQSFANAVRTAKKLEGKLDIRKPDYDLVLINGDGRQEFHFWLSPAADSAMFTYVSDTGTGYTLTEEAAGRLRKLIGTLPYTSEQAEENGDIVNMHGKITNLDKWNRFAANVKEGTPDEVHMTSYTIEGDPIFHDLLYDGRAIEATYDNSMDAFGAPDKKISFCKSIDQYKTERGTHYTLAQCDREEQTFSFTVEMDND